MARRKQTFIIGIDEVGRGPLAGPVAVGAVALTPRMLKKFRAIKESKQLLPHAREEWSRRMHDARGDELRVAVSMVSARVIDRIGIAPAIRRALKSAITKLDIHPSQCTVLLDGGLYAPPEYKKQKTIIRGDATETAIAMASVVAKVKRDRLMVARHNDLPHYGFDVHKGYGTRRHREAIRAHGLSALHRETFCQNSLHTSS